MRFPIVHFNQAMVTECEVCRIRVNGHLKGDRW